MRLGKKLAFLGFVSFSLHGVLLADQAAEKKAEAEAQPKAAEAKTYTEEQKEVFLKTFGWTLIMQGGVRNLGLSEQEVEHFIAGAKAAAKGEDSPGALGEVIESMQSFLQQKAASYASIRKEELKVISEKNKKEGKAFLEDLAKRSKSVKALPSGLHYEILSAGNEKEKPTENDTVEIQYVGKLSNGKIFDESKGKTVTFPLQGIVPGLKEGLQLIGKGGKIVLYLPSELGYGDFDIPNIPAGSLLIFEIDLVNITKTISPEKIEVDDKSDQIENNTAKS